MSGVETALIVGALASAGGAYNSYSTAKKQDQAAAQGIRAQAAKQRDASAQVNQLIDQRAGSNPDAAAAGANQQFLKQLAAARSPSIPQVGAASNRYTADAAGAQNDSNAYATDLAGIMSRIGAPAQQRQAEAVQMGRTSSAINQIGNAAAGEDFLTRLRASRIAPNPWLKAATDVGGAYAKAYTPAPRRTTGEALDSAMASNPDIF